MQWLVNTADESEIPSQTVTVFQLSSWVMSNSLQPHGLQQASLPIINSRSLVKFMSIELLMPSNHLILCLSLLLLPSLFPSIRVFSNESVLCIRWPKYWSFSFGISPSNEYSGLVSFRIDWFDLLAVQGTLKSLLQHHSSRASILWHSALSWALFMVQLSHPYITAFAWSSKRYVVLCYPDGRLCLFCWLISDTELV